MDSISVSLKTRCILPVSAVIRVVAVAIVLFWFSCPIAGQTISSADLLPDWTLNSSGSTVVPIQTPETLVSRPLRSLANVVRGEQSVRTRNGIGFRSVSVRAQDEIWFVSARRQESRCELTLHRLLGGQWVPVGMGELTLAHAVDQQRSSMVYVHGNRTDDKYARSRGLQFYENLFNGPSRSGPVRFVIFAWRSERERIRPSLDFNVKLNRSVELGSTFASFLEFASFLDQFHDRRIVLSGFSLGGQVVLSGLSQLQHDDKAGGFQVALITPVLKAEDTINSVASLPHNPAVTRTVVFVNQKDAALRAAMLAAKGTSGKPTITLEQIAAAPSCESINPVAIEDMTAQVTSCHSITKYSSKSLRLQAVINEMTDEFRSDSSSSCVECESTQLHAPEVLEGVIQEPVN